MRGTKRYKGSLNIFERKIPKLPLISSFVHLIGLNRFRVIEIRGYSAVLEPKWPLDLAARSNLWICITSSS
jgi:hypothetical protein